MKEDKKNEQNGLKDSTNRTKQNIMFYGGTQLNHVQIA